MRWFPREVEGKKIKPVNLSQTSLQTASLFACLRLAATAAASSAETPAFMAPVCVCMCACMCVCLCESMCVWRPLAQQPGSTKPHITIQNGFVNSPCVNLRCRFVNIPGCDVISSENCACVCVRERECVCVCLRFVCLCVCVRVYISTGLWIPLYICKCAVSVCEYTWMRCNLIWEFSKSVLE
jgi:hypothetical protein